MSGIGVKRSLLYGIIGIGNFAEKLAISSPKKVYFFLISFFLFSYFSALFYCIDNPPVSVLNSGKRGFYYMSKLAMLILHKNMPSAHP